MLSPSNLSILSLFVLIFDKDYLPYPTHLSSYRLFQDLPQVSHFFCWIFYTFILAELVLVTGYDYMWWEEENQKEE